MSIPAHIEHAFRDHTLRAMDKLTSAIPRAAATGRHSQDETGPEGSSPHADTGTAGVGVLYPVACRARFYDAASRILEDELHMFSHENCNELGALIQQWIERKHNNWEPR